MWIRLPRPAQIGVYVADKGSGHWLLQQVLEAAIVDEHSATVALSVDPSGSRDASITVEIAETGHPTIIGLTRASKLGSWAKATDAGLTGLGGGLDLTKTGLADVVATRASVETLRAARTEKAIADAERRARLLTAETAFASEVTTRTTTARKQRLELELAILKAEVGIHEARGALDER